MIPFNLPKTIIATLICCCIGNNTLFAQITAIPDVNFENYLISEGLDNVMDGGVLTANINNNPCRFNYGFIQRNLYGKHNN